MPTKTWNSATSGLWSSHNWTPGTAPPNSGDSVVLEQVGASTAAYTVTYDETQHPDIHVLTINFSGATLNFDGAHVLNVSTLTDVSAGTIDLLRSGALLDTTGLDVGTAGVVDVGSNGELAATTGNISDQGLLESTAGLGIVIGTLGGTGIVAAKGGTLDLASTSAQ